MVRHERLNLLSRPIRAPTRDVVPSVLREHVGFDTSWSHTVDGDATFSEIGRKSLDEADDGHLGCVVEGVVFDTQQTSSDGAHKDNTTVVLNVLVCRLANEELRPRVQVEYMIILFLANLLCDVPALCPRVAHDNVNFAKRLLGLLE